MEVFQKDREMLMQLFSVCYKLHNDKPVQTPQLHELRITPFS